MNRPIKPLTAVLWAFLPIFFLGFFIALATLNSGYSFNTKMQQAHIDNFQKTYRILEGDIKFKGEDQDYHFISVDGGDTWFAFEWRYSGRTEQTDLWHSHGWRDWPKADKDLYNLHYQQTKTQVQLPDRELLSLVLAREKVIKQVLPQFKGDRDQAMYHFESVRQYNKLYEPEIEVTSHPQPSEHPRVPVSPPDDLPPPPLVDDRNKKIDDALDKIQKSIDEIPAAELKLYKSLLLQSLNEKSDASEAD